MKKKSQEGQAAIVLGLSLFLLLLAAAISVDVGVMFADRRELQKAADFAALSGAQALPFDSEEARRIAGDFAMKNVREDLKERIAVLQTEISQTFIPNDTIEVTLIDESLPLYFANIIGKRTTKVIASAKVIVSSPIVATNVMPFGIMSKEPTLGTVFGYTFGEEVILKAPARSGTSGNFQFVDIIGMPNEQAGGAADIYDALREGGTENDVYKGETYYTQTGINGAQVVNSLSTWITCNHTFSEICTPPDENGFVDFMNPGNESPSCHRIIVCPIIINPEYPEGDYRRYNWSEVEGSKKVLIVDFVYFFIDDWGKTGNESWVRGRFVRAAGEDFLKFGAYSPFAPVVYRIIE